jgi:hypothetical protein
VSARPLELASPLVLEHFLRPPTRAEWDAERAAGWTGPDGSSASTDAIFGVRIGITAPEYDANRDADGFYPASLHDWFYQLARRLRLPSTWREPADAAYRDGCLARVAHLVGPVGAAADRRARARYLGLRLLGWRAWRTRAGLLRWAWSALRGS